MFHDHVNEFFKKFSSRTERPRPAIFLKNGSSLSCQASNYHYSSPRINDADKYDAVEVWLFDNSFLLFAKDYYYSEDEPLGYVPVEIVNEYIDICGGIDYDKYEGYVG